MGRVVRLADGALAPADLRADEKVVV
jgi:hypothetical protein